jgi:hypothetical protein
MLKIAFVVWVPLCGILILALVIKVFVADSLMGIFAAGAFFLVILFGWIVFSSHERWIDVASLRTSPFSLDPAIPFFYGRLGSDARSIEDQIAQREQRLMELKPEIMH